MEPQIPSNKKTLQEELWKTWLKVSQDHFPGFCTPFEILLLGLEKYLLEMSNIIKYHQSELCQNDQQLLQVLDSCYTSLLSLTLDCDLELCYLSSSLLPEELRPLFRTNSSNQEKTEDPTKQQALLLLQDNPHLVVKAEHVEVKHELLSDLEDDDLLSDYGEEGQAKCKCETCGKFLANKYSLKTHMKTHRTEKEALQIHREQLHSSNESKSGEVINNDHKSFCFFCRQEFSSNKERLKHERTHQGPWECRDCGKVLANRDIYKQHQSDIHSINNDCICDTCGVGFKNQRYLKDHMRNKHSGKLILCIDCGKQFKPSAYGDHRKYKHSAIPPERFNCEFCAKTFRSKRTLKSHLAIVHDSGEKTVLHCKYCSRKCISESQMKKHVLAMHLGLKVSCPLCPKEFSHKDSMMKHQALVHGQGGREVLYCDKCPTKFVTKAKLKEHINSKHLGLKHSCQSCGKEYSRKHKLVKHIKTGKCSDKNLLE